MRSSVILLTTVLLAASTAPLLAQRPDKGKGQGATQAQAAEKPPLTERERQIIRTYFTEHPVSAQALPPGIAKNLARGKPLPPGIAKKRAPSGLRTLLPERSGQDILIIGDRIVIADPVGLVVDVLSDIF